MDNEADYIDLCTTAMVVYDAMITRYKNLGIEPVAAKTIARESNAIPLNERVVEAIHRAEDHHVKAKMRHRTPAIAADFQQFKKRKKWVKDDALYLVGKAVRMTKHLTYDGKPMHCEEEN